MRFGHEVSDLFMSSEPESQRARRYLLGEASEEECSSVEREYFEHEEAIDRLAAAEDDLIEDYLSNRLPPTERKRFERAYLSVAHRRRRIETTRELIAAASRHSVRGTAPDVAASRVRATHRMRWLALAAGLILVASAALWEFAPWRVDQGRLVGDQRPAVPKPPAAAPAPASPNQPMSSSPAPTRVFAVSISPVAVRSAAENAVVIVPQGTEVLVLHLEGETGARKLVTGRASIRTVTGVEIWHGPATVEGGQLPGVIARIDVPAASLPVDDYLITLFATDRTGTEQEWSRYFLRVRAR
jgi:hypothetical protein